MKLTTCVVAVLCVLPRVGLAQTQSLPPAIPAAPINILVPNYNGVAAGQIGSLEANAFLVRANDSSSAYFNPAGLSLASQASVSGSAGLFQIARVRLDNTDGGGGSTQHIPSLVGLVLPKLFGRERWAGGFSLTRVNSWNQSTDAQHQLTIGPSSERLEYSSISELIGLQTNLGVGYTYSQRFRIGGSIDFQWTESKRSQTVSDQYRTASRLSAVLVQSHGSAQVAHLRLTASAQYDLTPKMRVGVLMRTRGFALWQDGSYVFEALAAGAATSTASFFDTNARAEYRLPFEFKAGVAWIGQRAQFEADVLTHAAAGRYAGFRTDQTWTVVTDPGLGAAPSVQQVSAVLPTIDSRAVINIALGGQVRLTPTSAWTLHAGYATDRSPVGPADTVFTKVNMQVITVGLSGRAKFVTASLAARYEAGTSPDFVLRDLQNGRQITSKLNVSNLGLVYSIAVLF